MAQTITSGRGQLLLLVTIGFAMILDGLDGTIVNVTLPEIAVSYGIGTSGTSWVVTVYFLMMAGLILVLGKISDKGGIKKVLTFGFLVFVLGSFLCGISPSLGVLLASRAIQGVGAAMLAASATILGVKFMPKERIGVALSLVVLGGSVGAALGPALGAVLTSIGSWHWIFFINVPLGLIAFFIARKAVPDDTGFDKSSFDLKGSVLLFIALVMGLYVVESLPSHGFTTTSAVALVLFVVLFAVFVVYERRVETPVLNLRLFKSVRFDTATVVFLMVNLTFMGAMYLVPFFMRVELGFGTLQSGAYLTVPAVFSLIFCLWVGKATATRGNKVFAAVSCVMLLIYTVVAANYSAEMSIAMLVVSFAVLGAVFGIGGGPLGGRMIENVPDSERAGASSILSFIMYFSSALGTVLFSGLFNLGSGGSGGSMSDLEPAAFLDGFQFAMLVGIVLAVIALVLTLALKDGRGKKAEAS